MDVCQSRHGILHVMNHKLVQHKMEEKDSAVAYGELTVDKNEVASDETITVPKQDECYSILQSNYRYSTCVLMLQNLQ